MNSLVGKVIWIQNNDYDYYPGIYIVREDNEKDPDLILDRECWKSQFGWGNRIGRVWVNERIFCWILS